jgi:hypothetical protein
MPSCFLTVRLTKTPDPRPQPSVDPNKDPLCWHEKKVHVFYETDSDAVAEKLLAMFQDEQKAQQGEKSEMARSIMGTLYPGATDWPWPIFALVNGDDLDLTQRVRYREKVAKIKELSPQYSAVPDLKQSTWILPELKLFKFHQEAEGWEPLIREELRLSKTNPPTPSAGESAGEKVSQSVSMSERAKVAYDQYLRAAPECASKDGREPTDQQCYDWLKAHNDGDSLPTSKTWQRYLREARKHSGEQKNAPRTGRQHGRSIVSAQDVEPPEATKTD